jgi:predicted nucleotidyltransferase component of viral defense system
MADRKVAMPLTVFQRAVLRLLAQNRRPDSYLAGGAALHFAPNSQRFSNDLDFDLAEQGIAVHFGSPGGVLPLPSGIRLAPHES